MKKTTTLLTLITLLTINFSFAQKKSDENYLLIGTYTKRTSEGIYVYKFNSKTGEATYVSTAKGVKNPSFLDISSNKKNVYSVGEVEGEGAVNSFSFDKKTGILQLLNSQGSGGANPCHISVDKTGKYAIVGNYTGGSLSILPIKTDGTLEKATQTIQHEGKGVNPDRQEKAHVHSVNIAPNNIDIFVPDLGTDKIVTYKLDDQTGKLSEGKPAFTKMEDGAGPRHFTLSPNGKYGYVIQELNSTITVFDYSKGKLKAKQTISTLPKDFKDKNACADIHISPDGKFLYGSNRFHDTIAMFSINPTNGKLTYIGEESVMGKIPRNFGIDPSGKFVLVANQESDNITIFERNVTTGKLKFTGKEIKVSMPVCLKFTSIN
jgi:6-phosphogluconolactonase